MPGGAPDSMMRRVQLSIADAGYATALREALSHTGPWRVETPGLPDLADPCVLVLDESAFARLPLPIVNPERIVLISRPDPELLAHAWDAGIVSVVSTCDSLPTVLLAIMAAALRVANAHGNPISSAISPNNGELSAPISPRIQISRSKRCKLR
jgi:hypothetical protein